MSRFHELWVITRAKNRAAIEQQLAKTRLPSVHWCFLDVPPWLRLWRKQPRGHHYYHLWQLRAYGLARRLHRQVSFDLVHHVTLVNYWTPSFLSLLPVPFLWGPVGGGESGPPAFWWSFSLRGKCYEVFRHLARRLGELNPFVRLTARRAALGLATTPETEARLRRLGCQRISVMSQVGLDAEDIRRLGALRAGPGKVFRVFSVGDLLHLKGFHLGLRAFACFQSHNPQSEYWIIGDGPERARLEGLARQLGVSRSIRFLGALPRTRVLENLARCDVLLHPALHESGGWVTLEAMAGARPVICLDVGGPATQITSGTGIKIAAVSPQEGVARLAEALERLALDPDKRLQMGEAARRRVEEHFNWEKKGSLMAGIYSDLPESHLKRAPQAVVA
jgi:glycosyltransferase involved in cell wall biosynthesis